jgi:hypothetical protein
MKGACFIKDIEHSKSALIEDADTGYVKVYS